MTISICKRIGRVSDAVIEQIKASNSRLERRLAKKNRKVQATSKSAVKTNIRRKRELTHNPFRSALKSLGNK